MKRSQQNACFQPCPLAVADIGIPCSKWSLGVGCHAGELFGGQSEFGFGSCAGGTSRTCCFFSCLLVWLLGGAEGGNVCGFFRDPGADLSKNGIPQKRQQVPVTVAVGDAQTPGLAVSKGTRLGHDHQKSVRSVSCYRFNLGPRDFYILLVES